MERGSVERGFWWRAESVLGDLEGLSEREAGWA